MRRDVVASVHGDAVARMTLHDARWYASVVEWCNISNSDVGEGYEWQQQHAGRSVQVVV